MNSPLTQNEAVHSEARQFRIEVVRSESPRLAVIKEFLSPEECDYLVQLGGEKILPSKTVDPETGEHIIVEARSSSSTHFTIGQTPIIDAIENRIAALVQIPVENGEGLQILNYKVGQCYQAHFDFFDPRLKGSAVATACGGQRVATCIMYLNDVEEGGETHFPEIDHKIKPIKGDAIVFFNIQPDGEVDRMSLHASLPVIAGEKWALTKWIRERAYVTPG